MENADVILGLHDFLERMRQPSASDIVKSIKSFIVSFTNNAPDPERDSVIVQEFLNNMEGVFRKHPLWAGCSEEELESAGEGLEKYVMTKLFSRVFASHPDDVKLDEDLSEKMALVQQFIRPENLDITPTFQNETSWLLAQKELQKINMCKAPRDKLVCILNCCKVINNLLINASIASNENPPGADEFLPVLIYVTIKASPPQLHSNLLYIQRYRRQSRLVAEAAYFFTNMLSAESFISNIDAKALSMDETEFSSNMESARALLSGLSADVDGLSSQTDSAGDYMPRAGQMEMKNQSSNRTPATPPKTSETKLKTKSVPYTSNQASMEKIPSLSDLENKGATMLLKEDQVSKTFQEFPYLFAQAGDLTVNDVEDLLSNYKRIVFKYICLSKGMNVATPQIPSKLQTGGPNQTETVKKSQDIHSEPQEDMDRTDDRVSLIEEESLVSKSPLDEPLEPQGNPVGETS
ncbi:vacuolar protein sorting-associated protein 9A [Eucalyptus grandis]|uniref:vacuolar protein sorting-associated protein 9A n=1 Tax=Eucalyptus grandis TaxID=71139 RepID=UPI000524D2B3|nr:vacuolar protein sorting-associated protein 9A [Eucalyptus grandis]